MNTALVNELLTSRMMLAGCGIDQLESILKHESAASARPLSDADIEQWALSVLSDRESSSVEYADGSVVVLPLTGVMTKYGRYDWMSDSLRFVVPGVDDIADALYLADADSKVKATVLLINSPGGTVSSWIRIEEVLRQRKKPCVALVDGMCASAAVYVASLCDKIYALNKICQIGSIGVMAHIVDTRQAEKKAGYKIIDVYPPESKYKNASLREAMDGDLKTLIDEELSPLARNFQQMVREHRPVNEKVEGVLEGKVFYASDAINAGLIDGICSLSEGIAIAEKLAKEKADIINYITNN